jgi:hypothetical protein
MILMIFDKIVKIDTLGILRKNHKCVKTRKSVKITKIDIFAPFWNRKNAKITKMTIFAFCH